MPQYNPEIEDHLNEVYVSHNYSKAKKALSFAFVSLICASSAIITNDMNKREGAISNKDGFPITMGAISALSFAMSLCYYKNYLSGRMGTSNVLHPNDPNQEGVVGHREDANLNVNNDVIEEGDFQHYHGENPDPTVANPQRHERISFDLVETVV